MTTSTSDERPRLLTYRNSEAITGRRFRRWLRRLPYAFAQFVEAGKLHCTRGCLLGLSQIGDEARGTDCHACTNPARYRCLQWSPAQGGRLSRASVRTFGARVASRAWLEWRRRASFHRELTSLPLTRTAPASSRWGRRRTRILDEAWLIHAFTALAAQCSFTSWWHARRIEREIPHPTGIALCPLRNKGGRQPRRRGEPEDPGLELRTRAEVLEAPTIPAAARRPALAGLAAPRPALAGLTASAGPAGIAVRAVAAVKQALPR